MDGARLRGERGWVAVRLKGGRLRDIAWHPRLTEVMEAMASDAAVVGLDMPVGHDDPDGALRGGRRQCDQEARRALGPRQASVFMMPPPSLLALPTQEAASAEAKARGWIAPSAQLWNIRDAIAEAEAVWAHEPRLHEVHPELAFQAMLRTLTPAREGHLAHPKRTLDGLHERLALLHRAGLRPSRSFGGVGRASPEDVLDATAVAWSAARIARGEATSYPLEPSADPALGRRVEIWS